MKFAIIAAGEGSRLAQEGIVSPKPLIEVAGQHLIDRLMDVFREVGASELWSATTSVQRSQPISPK